MRSAGDAGTEIPAMAEGAGRGPALVLASGSRFRRQMLEAAGVTFSVVAADIDERGLEESLRQGEGGADASRIAAALARAKAQHVARMHPQALVIGCDQVLDLDGALLSKAPDIAAARGQLLRLRGRTHTLYTAVCLAKSEHFVWEYMARPRLTMRPFTDAYLDQYVKEMGGRLTQTVGAYEIEGPGVQLFERIEGDYFTILGLPLLPLLAELRRRGLAGL